MSFFYFWKSFFKIIFRLLILFDIWQNSFWAIRICLASIAGITPSDWFLAKLTRQPTMGASRWMLSSIDTVKLGLRVSLWFWLFRRRFNIYSSKKLKSPTNYNAPILSTVTKLFKVSRLFLPTFINFTLIILSAAKKNLRRTSSMFVVKISMKLSRLNLFCFVFEINFHFRNERIR